MGGTGINFRAHGRGAYHLTSHVAEKPEEFRLLARKRPFDLPQILCETECLPRRFRCRNGTGKTGAISMESIV